MTKEVTATPAERERAVDKVVAADIEKSDELIWSGSTVNLVKAKYPDLDMVDIRLYGRLCVARGIDPTSGDLIPVVFGKGKARGGKNGRTLVVIETIDSLRKRAWASGLVAAIKGPEWCGSDGEWKDVWLEDEAPLAARFGVLRVDVEEMHWSVRLMKEVRKTGTGDDFWRDEGESAQPVNMIGIAAERHGWRKNIPNLFASIYRGDLVGPVAGEADVDRLPEYIDHDLLGPVVADEDGVIDESSDDRSDPAPSNKGTDDGDTVDPEPGDRSGDRPGQMQMNTKLVIGTLEVAMQAMKVDHDAIGAVTGATEDDDVAAWLLEQMGEERNIKALNVAIAQLCTMAADA